MPSKLDGGAAFLWFTCPKVPLAKKVSAPRAIPEAL